MNTLPRTHLNAEIERAIQQRNVAAQDYQDHMTWWGRGLVTAEELSDAATWLDACEAEVERMIDSPAITRLTYAQERAAQKSDYFNRILGR